MNFVSLLLLCSLVAVGLAAVIEKKAEKDKLLESATVPSLSSPLPGGSSRNSTTSLPKVGPLSHGKKELLEKV